MDTIRDLLEHAEQLDESDRALLLKLIWHCSQMDDDTQAEVTAAIRIFLPHAETDWDRFMTVVRALVRQLDRQHAGQ